jgi:TolB-like protein/Flp pilus assembly protein TadD
MSDSATAPGQMSEPPANEARLESWGEIAAYLRRDVRTVQRWERYHGLPVRRLQVGKLPTVYAYRSELDKWFLEHQPKPEAEDPHDEAIPGEDVSAELTASAPREESGDVIHPKSFGLRSALFAGLILLAVAGGIYYFLLASKSQLTGRAPEKTRLFVRPFANHSGDSKQDEFTEGLTDEINTQLGRLDPDHLGVIAPFSAKLLSGKSIPDLVNLLGIQYVLEGSVRRAGAQVRIDVDLVSVGDQTPVWADSYTDDLSDILQVQDKVAAAVAEKILTRLPRTAPPSRTNSVDFEGYQAYLRGRRFWAIRDLPHSVEAYQKAVQKLPDYLLAHAGLAAAYAVSGEAPNDVVPATISAPKAREEAHRALAIDPKNAEAHYVLANIAMSYDWDFSTAEREFSEAIRLEPNNPTAHQWWGQFLMVRNRIPEAQTETSKALDLDPVSPIFTTARAEAFYYAHDFDSTISHAKLTLDQTPNFVLAEFWLGSAYREKKMYRESLDHFEKACKVAPDNPALLMAYGHSLASSGDISGARKVLNQLTALWNTRFVPAIYFAGLYTALGDKNSAFKWLDKAVAEHDDRLIYLGVDPIADPLRPDPRFRALMNRLHLP